MTSPDVAQIVRGLTKAQRAIIPHMSNGELVYPLKGLVEDLPGNIRLYRDAVAGLRAIGLAEHGSLWNDEGGICGSGTWLTPLGQQVRAAITGEVVRGDMEGREP